jgi:type I restriction enzyme S subunit
VNGFAFKPADLTGSATPVVRIRQLLDPEAEVDRTDLALDSRFTINDGDLIFSWSGTLAVGVWNRGPALLNQHLFRVDPESGVDGRWLRYALEHSLVDAKCFMHGSAMTHITREVLDKLTVEVPAEREQREIADSLDAETARIDDALSRAESLRTLIDERTASVRERLLTGLIAMLVPLRRVATIQTGLTLNAGKNSAAMQERPYLRVANVQPGALDLDTVKRVHVSDEQIHRHSLRYGDVLMTEGGDRDKLGRGVVWRDEVPAALHQNHVFAVRTHLGKLLPEYLEMVLASTHARRYFETTANQTTNLASTNTGVVGALDVPLPPVRDQLRIVEEFSDVEHRHQALRTAACRQIALLRERRQALITAAVSQTVA